MIDSSQITNSEFVKLNGCLTLERIEPLLDVEQAYTQILEGDSLLDEVEGSFPKEDFAAKIIGALHTLAKRMRGDTKDTLLGIISDLEEKQMEIYRETEHGRDNLATYRSLIGD